jgi:hypothetical protein
MQAHIVEATHQEPAALVPGIGHNGGPPFEFADTAGTAKRAGLGKSTLEKLRMTGGGPAYRKIGSRKVVYYWPDVVRWLDARIRHSTSEKEVA